ncbi:MAG: TatD family hydrolase [Clostridia bacterium]|nr:TatD family hydrolase [Clostridia bacterium]
MTEESGRDLPLITDTHAHFTDERFSEYPGGTDALLDEIFANGVGRILNVSVSTANSADVYAQSLGRSGLYAAVGVHPTETAGEVSPDHAAGILSAMIDADRASGKNMIVAIGETGLDYHYEDTDRIVQHSFFEMQLCLSETVGLPVIVHDRDAHGDCFEAVLRHPGVKGVFHSYSGSAEMAAELVRRGWYISFSGVITFKNAPRVRAVAASVPAGRLLLETDAPYLTPEPFRGRMNRSDYIRYTAGVLASLHGMSAAEMIATAGSNAERLFGFPGFQSFSST